MKKLIITILICVFIVACTPKGEEGGKCLEDRTCNNSLLVCTKENKCAECGTTLDEGCCPTNPPWCLVGACNSENLCVTTYCPPGEECYNCGYPSDPCCENRQCFYGSACNTEGNCERCGGFHELPCPVSICNGWLRLYGTTCDNPFHHGDMIDIEECRIPLDGEFMGHSSEWCFWYVAYNSGDTNICGQIQWEQMRNLCGQGEDPDDYYTTLTLDYFPIKIEYNCLCDLRIDSSCLVKQPIF